DKQLRRRTKPGRTTLFVLLAIVALVAGLLYSQRYLVQSLLTGTHFVGGNQAVANVHLPAGFHASVFYAGLSSPRFITFGPDGNLYVSIGSTCNNCVESDPHRAAVWIYHLDGSGGRLYARGLRNAVGMAVNPWNNQVWVTNNGRDLLGDNTPPETIYALHEGGNYGWPFCHAGDIIDPELGHPGDCNGVVQPLIKMQAHSAPLGLAFYTASQFPRRYHGLFVAFHGSWNRSIPTGYK